MNSKTATVIVSLFLILVAASCQKWDVRHQDDDFAKTIVVDGWIESGGFPFVFLTSTSDYESVIDSSRYFNLVMTHAKVTVWNDNQREVLTLSRDMKLFPPHYYRGNRIRGKAGKTYHLELVLYGDTLRATTTIPAAPSLKKLWFVADRADTNMGTIWMGFDDSDSTKDYYRAMTRVQHKEAKFTATHLSVLDDDLINGSYIEFPLYHGLTTNTNKKIDFRYQRDDTVFVKLCTIDEMSYKFWASFEREMLNSSNPFGSGGGNLVSNIEGGMGIWCGYGVTMKSIITK